MDVPVFVHDLARADDRDADQVAVLVVAQRVPLGRLVEVDGTSTVSKSIVAMMLMGTTFAAYDSTAASRRCTPP
jgi:hypothetical protein